MQIDEKLYIEYRKKAGANIRKFRKAKGYSQVEFAKMIGFTPQSLSCIESGSTNPSFKAMVKIAISLEIPLSYIYTFDERTYDMQDEQLKYLAFEAFNGLDYDKRQIAYKLIDCFKSNTQ